MIFKKNITIADGCKTVYWEKNNGEAKALVLLHGFPGNHRVVIDMAKNLKGFRLIIPDLPACGESDSLLEEHILNNYSKWFYEFLENVSADKIILVGYSFGSRIAVTFSDLHPEKVGKLALITPVVKFDSLIARLASYQYELAEKLPLHVQKIWLSNKFYHSISNKIIFKSASKKRRQYLITNDAKEIKRIDSKANLEIFDEFYKSKLISEGSKINIKTLLIAADKDEIATLNSVKELCGRFTNYKFEIIKNSGHIVVAERPKKVASIINNWLK